MSALLRKAANSEEVHDLLAFACLLCWVGGVFVVCLAADMFRVVPLQ